MSEDTKNRLDPRVASALFYLQIHCTRNETQVGLKYLKTASGKIITICKGDNGTYASIGIDKKDEVKVYMEDKKMVKWARMEGFSENEIYTEMEDQVVKESTIVDLAKALIS